MKEIRWPDVVVMAIPWLATWLAIAFIVLLLHTLRFP
jgi:hypothetical protein